MRLKELFTSDVVKLDLESQSKDDLLKELVSLLALDEKSAAILFKTLKRRENLGSTGIGKGIAIPHCRTLVVNRLRLAYGRKPGGVDFNAIDGEPVYNFFLIIARRSKSRTSTYRYWGRSRSSPRTLLCRANLESSPSRKTSLRFSPKRHRKRQPSVPTSARISS